MAGRDTSLGSGVFYELTEYVGLARRVLVLAIDLSLIVAVGFILSLLTELFLELTSRQLRGIHGLLVWASIWIVLPYLYLTLVKASRIRTLGYRLARCKVVTLRGQRPSMLRMTFRLGLWAIGGPFSFVFDLLWSGIDEDRQTLRDRFAGTCVINANANPIGEGEIHLTHFTAAGFHLMYPKVMR